MRTQLHGAITYVIYEKFLVRVKISWRGSNVTRSKIRISFTVPQDRQCRRAISKRTVV